jgi:4-amino-4-deoxy-L-arabinose transferase-like glycosyltransferase
MIFALVNFSSVLRNFSLTTDEDKHILYGENIVAGDATRIDDSKMPVTALNALPKKLASVVDNVKLKYYLNKLYVARSVTIFFSCLLGLLVFYWSRSLYGFIPALFSLTLYVLDPNIIAHSQLVATDLYLTAAISFAFFTLWKFANERNVRNGLACLFALGAAQLVKYTAIILFPLFFMTIVLYDAPVWIESMRSGKNISALILKYVRYIIFALISTIIIINFGFLFNRTFTRFGDYRLRSDIFMRIQSDFPILHNVPVPVPYPYLKGLDWMRSTEQTGYLSGRVYLLGQISELKGIPGYYFAASLLKVPITSQIIYLMAIAAYFTRKGNGEHLRRNGIFFLVPVLFFAIYFNFFFNTQIGIRYYLPVYPLLYVFSGFLCINWSNFSLFQKSSTFALLIYLFISVVSYYPYHMSYMNELIGNRLNAYKYLADSNLDWSQAKNEYRQYVSDHPGVIINPRNSPPSNPNKPRPGLFILRINDLVGVTEDPERFAWLRNNFEPRETVAYAYLVYEITPEQIAELCATTTYCKK